ncbi:aminotransferase-like domain-containing protein [Bacillus pseudomycoides]|uniref:GntR family transcriptional regulator n=1 Tax=Bacillus pseudomycoides TaxID=64104 RepID=A0A2C3U2S2_9BACI|nr:PLP-dependent aminotransferase family protein [Bacillus pseudomycoides]PDY46297.1 GntR family transcriptional regulator [Bacillus pseudomycoides]PED05946.1 GntR family transcriptional regulator [Bacillus pseudomycoides]PEK23556.1 GntR family transcriptional regulator [Bacillus pseudomycoides]PEM57674.1 GntR family transcriptional regulator [Bacillus pseudomycoides]PEO07087.1 GntR family transcriptional regulator [Bacillus pseudomycoides]
MKWKPNRHSHLTVQEQIVDWIKSHIERGDWTVGTKIPTQRQLATQFNVNRSTVQLALDELKADGLLESKVGSGIFVANNSWNVLLNRSQPNWQQHIESSIHKPNYHTIQLINEYEQMDHIIRLGTGELSPELLPTKQIEQSLKKISLESKAIGYSSPQGSEKLRGILCNYLKKRGIQAAPENILIVSGALQALQLIAFGLLEEGSIVFQEQPSYLNSVHPFQSAGMRMITVSRDRYLTDNLRALKRKRQSLFYCVPTLHNPTGYNWSMEEKKKLYNACKELQIPIIEDDVYHELLFESSFPAMKSFDTSGQVLYIGSVSKTLSPGLRIGWVVAPSSVIERLSDIKMQTDYGSSAFSQEIVSYWISSGLYEKHLIKLREQLKRRATFVEEILEQQFQKIATWKKSEGGFYIWIRFHEPIVNKALFLNLLNQNVLINPGYIYESSDLHHIRLSYAYASLEELKKGLNILLELVQH